MKSNVNAADLKANDGNISDEQSKSIPDEDVEGRLELRDVRLHTKKPLIPQLNGLRKKDHIT